MSQTTRSQASAGPRRPWYDTDGPWLGVLLLAFLIDCFDQGTVAVLLIVLFLLSIPARLWLRLQRQRASEAAARPPD